MNSDQQSTREKKNSVWYSGYEENIKSAKKNQPNKQKTERKRIFLRVSLMKPFGVKY